MVVRARGDAPADRVYAMLADLSSHLEWGGRRQLRTARIKTLDAPEAPAVAGTEFASVGGFPGWRLHESHIVTEANAPVAFEFHTKTDARPTIIGSPWQATFEHRYEVTPDGTGSRVTYRFLQTRIENAPWRFSLPVLRPLSYAVVRFVARRGVRNLLALAREQGRP